MRGERERGPSDREVVRRLAADTDAICVLYDRHFISLVAALARRSGDRDLAFDIAQETFARALERGRHVPVSAEGSAWPWLWTVASRLLVDHHRRGRVDDRARRRLGIARVPPDDALDGALERADAQTVFEDVRSALAALPPEHREAMAGRFALDLSYRDLAEATGVSEETLRARVARALRSLRLRLSGLEPKGGKP